MYLSQLVMEAETRLEPKWSGDRDNEEHAGFGVPYAELQWLASTP